MSEYFFGLGEGWMPKAAAKIAAKYGATLVNHTDPGCKCGYGCMSGECKSARRHWFSGPNRGHPFDTKMASAVMAEIATLNIAAK